MNPQILVVDYGSQYTLLIAKILRQLKVYCEVIKPDQIPSDHSQIKGLILSGGPDSQANTNQDYDPSQLKYNLAETFPNLPILGICYGAQLLARCYGAEVISQATREYGQATINLVRQGDPIYRKIQAFHTVWMSHSDSINLGATSNSKENLVLLSETSKKVPACYKARNHPHYGFQFHPEVTHTPEGARLLSNFLSVAGCVRNWTSESFLQQALPRLQTEIPEQERVMVACSGGVDSTVVATILQKALGSDRFIGVFVNNGLLRAGEYEQVLQAYAEMGLNVKGIDASERFYIALKGITDPETKRRIIGHLFIDIFTEFAKTENKQYPDKPIKWLGQGTIYPDIVESHGKIKSHHNVGGLPEKLDLELVEPLRLLFKDEVRRVGQELKIDPVILNRHPFPGPGLGIRILGSINRTKVQILQMADSIWLDMLREHGYYDHVWQAPTVLLDSKSVGVMGDNRTYESVVAIRAVNSENGMTASVCDLPMKFLTAVSTRIVNEVPGVNRVVYDITTKPPGTIEWE